MALRGGSKYLTFWVSKRERTEEKERRRRRGRGREEEEKRMREKKKQSQKGMELYRISKVLNGFPCNCMVIILPKLRVC